MPPNHVSQSIAASASARGASSQSVDLKKPCRAISSMQHRRIVAALEQGVCERRIAQTEGLPETVVRRIRTLELDRHKRQMAAVGTSVSLFLENVRLLHADIDRGIFEELSGAA